MLPPINQPDQDSVAATNNLVDELQLKVSSLQTELQKTQTASS